MQTSRQGDPEALTLPEGRVACGWSVVTGPRGPPRAHAEEEAVGGALRACGWDRPAEEGRGLQLHPTPSPEEGR